MKYILNKNAALREWNDNRYPYALIIRKNPKPLRLTKKEFDFIKLADGQHEFTEDVIASQSFKKALGMHLIQEAKEGDALSDWQKYHYYDNPHFNSISLRLTGRCNMNCKHCFNAADVNTDNSQWTFEEAKKLIDDAAECGIRMFRITGGEPMLHPDFIKVVQYIKEKGMVPRDILTNGAFITQEILDEIKKVNKHATFVISGAPGIGSIILSMNRFKDIIPNYDENLKRAVESCMRQKIMYRDHICCGNGAVADFMINLYNTTGKEEYMNRVKELMITDTEYAFLPITHRNSFVIGFYFGACGVGYELLRILNPTKIPSVLV